MHILVIVIVYVNNHIKNLDDIFSEIKKKGNERRTSEIH